MGRTRAWRPSSQAGGSMSPGPPKGRCSMSHLLRVSQQARPTRAVLPIAVEEGAGTKIATVTANVVRHANAAGVLPIAGTDILARTITTSKPDREGQEIWQKRSQKRS